MLPLNVIVISLISKFSSQSLYSAWRFPRVYQSLDNKKQKIRSSNLMECFSADPSLLILVNHSQSQKFPSFKNFPCSVFTQKSLSRIFSGRASVQVKPKLNMIQKTSRCSSISSLSSKALQMHRQCCSHLRARHLPSMARFYFSLMSAGLAWVPDRILA